MCNNQYYKELAAFKNLTNEELLNEFKLFNIGDEKAFGKIIKANLKLVVLVAKEYQTENVDDLINEGNIGLIESVKRFDSSKNVKFSHYAKIWIKKYMNDFIISDNTIRISHNKYYEMKKNNEMLIKMLDDFEQLFETITDESDSDELDVENFEKILIASKDLNPTEKKIITMYYGIGCECQTLLEISLQLNKSKQRIGQIKKVALQKIRKVLGL